jgi:hypothetical protein
MSKDRHFGNAELNANDDELRREIASDIERRILPMCELEDEIALMKLAIALVRGF